MRARTIDLESKLIEAIKNNNSAETIAEHFIKLQYNDPVSLYVDQLGNSLLHWAAMKNQLQASIFLLKNISKKQNVLDIINCINLYGYTALHYACKANNKEMAELLIRFGADIHVKNNFQSTPLILANHYTIRYLYSNGAFIGQVMTNEIISLLCLHTPIQSALLNANHINSDTYLDPILSKKIFYTLNETRRLKLLGQMRRALEQNPDHHAIKKFYLSYYATKSLKELLIGNIEIDKRFPSIMTKNVRSSLPKDLYDEMYQHFHRPQRKIDGRYAYEYLHDDAKSLIELIKKINDYLINLDKRAIKYCDYTYVNYAAKTLSIGLAIATMLALSLGYYQYVKEGLPLGINLWILLPTILFIPILTAVMIYIIGWTLNKILGKDKQITSGEFKNLLAELQTEIIDKLSHSQTFDSACAMNTSSLNKLKNLLSKLHHKNNIYDVIDTFKEINQNIQILHKRTVLSGTSFSMFYKPRNGSNHDVVITIHDKNERKALLP